MRSRAPASVDFIDRPRLAIRVPGPAPPSPPPGPTPTLRGRHVTLEPLRGEHAAELWPQAQDADLWRYMLFDVACEADLARWIEARLVPVRAGTAQAFLQRDATGRAVGSTSVFDISPWRAMEVGHTWIGPAGRRTGLNTEAKRLVLEHCFAPLGAIRVQIKCDERNARSRAAIERLGATFEGYLRHQMLLADGHKRTAAVYSILDTEWPRVRDRLDARLARPA